MRFIPATLIVLAGLLSSAASAASAQPPMGDFLGAFYTCDQGQAFQISYDSKSPTAATITTSNNNARYELKRRAGAAGSQFSNGTVSVSVAFSAKFSECPESANFFMYSGS